MREAGRIQVAVGRMTRVIDDMLELARAGRLAPGRIQPADAVARVVEDVRALGGGCEIFASPDAGTAVFVRLPRAAP